MPPAWGRRAIVPRPRRKTTTFSFSGFLTRNIRTLSGLLLTAVLAGLLLLGMRWLSDPYRFPLNVVEVKGDYRYLERNSLQAAVLPLMTGGFFTVDVSAIRTAAEALPWVYKAKVQRVWPDKLRLHIEEQLPVARWGTRGLLNRHGQSFVPQDTSALRGLPQLSGPAGQERKVLQAYHQACRILKPLGMQVTRFGLDERRAWHVLLDSNIELELGRASAWPRLYRFVRVFPQVFAGRLAELQRVDMRYSNGFSVFWQQAETGDSMDTRG
jgi:cell division protein FtsQ